MVPSLFEVGGIIVFRLNVFGEEWVLDRFVFSRPCDIIMPKVSSVVRCVRALELSERIIPSAI